MSMESKMSGFEGDVVTHRASVGNAGSAQDQYAKFMLLKEKLAARATGAPAEVRDILGNLSEVESVSVEVIKHLNKYAESSPERADVAQQTGTTDIFEQATWIAERLVAKQRAEAFMDLYSPNKAALKMEFLARNAVGLGARVDKMKENGKALDATIAAAAGGASPIAVIGRGIAERFGLVKKDATTGVYARA